MLVSPRKNGLDSLFKEVRVFKGLVLQLSDAAVLPSAIVATTCTTRTEIIAYMIYLEGPEYPEYVMHPANKGLPLPLGRGVCQTKSKHGRSRPRKPFISRGFLCSEGV